MFRNQDFKADHIYYVRYLLNEDVSQNLRRICFQKNDFEVTVQFFIVMVNKTVYVKYADRYQKIYMIKQSFYIFDEKWNHFGK